MNTPVLIPQKKRTRGRTPRTTPATHCAGIVTARDEGRYSFVSGELQTEARRAASCLLEPEVGDTVACLEVAPREFWIVAVLQREEGVDDVLRFQRNAHVETAGTELTLKAGSIALQTQTFQLAADDAEMVADRAHWVGSEFKAVGKAFKIAGAVLSTAFDRVSHFSKHHLRITEGLDRVRAQTLQQEAAQLMQLSAEHTLINGEKLVKARGGQIHLG